MEMVDESSSISSSQAGEHLVTDTATADNKLVSHESFQERDTKEEQLSVQRRNAEPCFVGVEPNLPSLHRVKREQLDEDCTHATQSFSEINPQPSIDVMEMVDEASSILPSQSGELLVTDTATADNFSNMHVSHERFQEMDTEEEQLCPQNSNGETCCVDGETNLPSSDFSLHRVKRERLVEDCTQATQSFISHEIKEHELETEDDITWYEVKDIDSEEKARSAVYSSDIEGNSDEYNSSLPASESGSSELHSSLANQRAPCQQDLYEKVQHYQKNKGMFTSYSTEQICENILSQPIHNSNVIYFLCVICHMDFAFIPNMIKHSISHINGTARLICQKCGRTFRSKSLYEIHSDFHKLGLWREIEGSSFRRFTCTMCHKFFPYMHLLIEHKVKHNGESHPYECGCCEKKFRSTRERQKHELSHKPKERRLECTVCNKTSACKITLAKHMDTHTLFNKEVNGYQCRQCEAVFSSLTKLRFHERTHKRGSFLCERCGRVFDKALYMRYHRPHCSAKPTKEPHNPE